MKFFCTLDIARTILEQAKAELPSDKVLVSVTLKPPETWTSLRDSVIPRTNCRA
jgi:hypothetical protein